MDALSAAGRAGDALPIGDEARAVATELLERQPTHLLALRARALVNSSASAAHDEQFRPAARLQAAEAGSQDWLLMARVDPTNAITVNNLNVARRAQGVALLDLGRPREAAARMVADRTLQETIAAKSTMVAGALSENLWRAGRIHAELGEAAQAERLEPDAFMQYGRWARQFEPNSFEARLSALAEPALRAELALAGGDMARARAAAKGARESLVELDPGSDPDRRRQWASQLHFLHAAMVRVELESNDFAAAERESRRVTEARRDLPLDVLSERRSHAGDLASWALALARLGRVDEARPKAEQALAFQRGLHAMADGDELHKRDFALALVASAWADPGRARELLAEARSVFDSMPADARALRSSRWIEGLIADAQRSLR
jgi:hypothetical protein